MSRPLVRGLFFILIWALCAEALGGKLVPLLNNPVSCGEGTIQERKPRV